MSAFFAALLLAVCWPAAAFAPLRHARAPLRTGTRAVHSSAGAPRVPRRAILHLAPAAAALPAASWANSDKIVSKFATQAPPTDKDAEPFTYLESGVSYREYAAGKGEKEVEEGSRVTVNCVGRLLNLNGVKFFSTKEKTDEFGEGKPLTFTIGAGEALPGLEEGMLGMKKGAIRKIIVPPALGYAAGNSLLPQPREGPGQGRAALDSVLKNPRRDATLLFEVKVEALK